MNARKSENYHAHPVHKKNSVDMFIGRDMSRTTFLRSKLVSFNQTLVPYEISKVNFRVQIFFSCEYVRRDLTKSENSKIT